ncbi:hypothetical protein [Streptomyces sp. NPDC007088]|uniref:hypothetical protein n=1 Tax=Streptomyces sp. NPDC007088 TaxID=3364773 RepID=UPI00369E3B6E
MTDQSQTVAPKPAQPHRICGECGHTHARAIGPQPGTRRWFAYKAGTNLMLAIVPVLPLVKGITNLIHPSAEVDLTGAQREALNAQFEVSGHTATTVRQVTVELDHPSLMDRLVAAGPSLLLAGLLLFLAYALWRIEINMTAGPQQRPFTEKDQRVLSRAAQYLWGFWWAFLALEAFGFRALHLGGTGAAGSLTSGSIVVLGLSVLVGSFARTYRKGRTAYNEMQGIV